MGLISTASFILATQVPPPPQGGPNQTPGLKFGSALHEKDEQEAEAPKIVVPQDRISEIWDHVDNRLVTQSDVWFERGEFPMCISMLRVQYAYSPNDQDVMSSLGWMLENVEQIDDARGVYIDFSKNNPDNADAIFSLGFSYYNKKDFDNTIKFLEPSLTKNPSPNTYRILAKAYEKKGKFSDAVRVWEVELKRFPGEPTAIANIKRVKAKMGSGGK